MVSVVVEANKVRERRRSEVQSVVLDGSRERERERDESDLELRSLSITKKISFDAKSR